MNSRSPIEINFWSRADLAGSAYTLLPFAYTVWRVWSRILGTNWIEASDHLKTHTHTPQIVPEVGYIALQLKIYVWSIYKWFQLSLILFLSRRNYSFHALSCLKTIHTDFTFLTCIVIHLLISLQFCHLQIDETVDESCQSEASVARKLLKK